MGKNVMSKGERLIRAAATESVWEQDWGGGKLGGWANIAIDGNTKQAIKGILGSFTLIDHRWRWVKGLSESGGVIH